MYKINAASGMIKMYSPTMVIRDSKERLGHWWLTPSKLQT